MKQFEMTINGTKTLLEDKSYAGIFRQFWAHFMNLDLDKTISTIERAGIRTSSSEYFVSINGSKKRNILVKEGFWIYTHLTPAAMEKAFEKFISEWELSLKDEQVVELENSQEYNHRGTQKLKNIYKKTLAMELVRLGHNLHHTMRNRENQKYQIFVFPHTEQLDRDIATLTGNEYEKNRCSESK